MKTITNIKDEVAKEYDFANWVTIYNLDEVSNIVIDTVAKEYAREALRDAADIVHANYDKSKLDLQVMILAIADKFI